MWELKCIENAQLNKPSPILQFFQRIFTTGQGYGYDAPTIGIEIIVHLVSLGNEPAGQLNSKSLIKTVLVKNICLKTRMSYIITIKRCIGQPIALGPKVPFPSGPAPASPPICDIAL